MPRWTYEARQMQAERIRTLCPWKNSTGPRTEEGKARSSRNAWKGGVRSTATEYAAMIRDFGTMTKVLFSSIRGKRTQTAPARSAPVQPNSGPGLSTSFGSFQKRNTDNGKRNTPPGLSTSFGENGEMPPGFTLVRRKPVELPADLGMPPEDPQFDKLSPEALIAIAEDLLGGGLFSSFTQNQAFSPSTINHQPPTR